jgi:hypothetical protein
VRKRELQSHRSYRSHKSHPFILLNASLISIVSHANLRRPPSSWILAPSSFQLTGVSYTSEESRAFDL